MTYYKRQSTNSKWNSNIMMGVLAGSVSVPLQIGWSFSLCFFTDSDGVCAGSHLLNITLTMHRLLMSSSDLMEKLTTLYPSEIEQYHRLVIRRRQAGWKACGVGAASVQNYSGGGIGSAAPVAPFVPLPFGCQWQRPIKHSHMGFTSGSATLAFSVKKKKKTPWEASVCGHSCRLLQRRMCRVVCFRRRRRLFVAQGGLQKMILRTIDRKMIVLLIQIYAQTRTDTLFTVDLQEWPVMKQPKMTKM